MNLSDKLLRLAFRYTLMADDKAAVEQAASELDRQGAALAEMREALEAISDKSNTRIAHPDNCSCSQHIAIRALHSTDAGTGYVPKAELEQAHQRIAELEKDKARLETVMGLLSTTQYGQLLSTRSTIDAIIKERQ